MTHSLPWWLTRSPQHICTQIKLSVYGCNDVYIYIVPYLISQKTDKPDTNKPGSMDVSSKKLSYVSHDWKKTASFISCSIWYIQYLNPTEWKTINYIQLTQSTQPNFDLCYEYYPNDIFSDFEVGSTESHVQNTLCQSFPAPVYNNCTFNINISK